MKFEFFLALLVIAAFSVIHCIEMASFLARVAGVRGDNKAMAYSLQNAVFMLTRFFSMLMLPVLGFLIDRQVSREFYIGMVASALGGAFFMSFSVFLVRGRFVSLFMSVVEEVKSGKSLLFLIFLVPFRIFRVSSARVVRAKFEGGVFFWGSALIFGIYAVSIFLSFYFGLVFPDYRASISQLSGVTNALATVLLTFYLEPRISMAIDKEECAEEILTAFLLGRLLGVGLLSQLMIFSMHWLVP